MGVTHKPKAGALLTGTEYEAADSHITSIAHADTTGITATDHHAAPAAGPDANITVDAAGAAGTASTFARSGHGHQVVTDSGVASTQAFGDTATAGTSGTIQRGGHKHAMPANPVSFATPAIVLGTAAAAGAASTVIRSDSTIVAFDATTPANVGTAATGSQAVAARRDHVHATGAGTPSTQAFADAAATGSGPAASMTDHKHAMPTLGYGLSGNSAPAVGLTTASAFITATTSLSASTYADITGASVSLAAGTWLIMANVFATDTTTTAGLLVAAITDNANAVVCEGAMSIPAGTATVSTWGHVGLCAFVSPGTTTTYKLRGARGTTTATATLVVQDGSPQNVANNASTNTDKGTGIFAVRIA